MVRFLLMVFLVAQGVVAQAAESEYFDSSLCFNFDTDRPEDLERKKRLIMQRDPRGRVLWHWYVWQNSDGNYEPICRDIYSAECGGDFTRWPGSLGAMGGNPFICLPSRSNLPPFS